MKVTVEQLQKAEKGANLSDYIPGSANWWEVFAVHVNHVPGRDLSGERWAVIFAACTFARTNDANDLLRLKNAVEKYQTGVAENEKGTTVT